MRKAIKYGIILLLVHQISQLYGQNWIPFAPETPSFTAFAINPIDTNYVYAGYYNGLAKSIDGGKNWTQIAFLNSDEVQSLVINPLHPDTLYMGVVAIGTGGHGIYRSANRGNSWTQVYSSKSISQIAVDPIQPNILYAGSITESYMGASVGFLKSSDRGNTWTESNSGLDNLEIHTITIDPSNTNTIYVGTDGGVFKSTDGGGTWTGVNSGLPGGVLIKSFEINKTNPSILLVGTNGDGLFKSINGGANWTSSNNGISNSIINSIVISATYSHVAYASTQSGGVYKSLNSGNTWTLMNTSGVSYVGDAGPLFINPLNSEIIYSFYGWGTTGCRLYKRFENVTPPSITSITPSSGNVGSTVTITGSNFNPIVERNFVWFGAAKATVTSASSTSLSVIVPSGATYQPISVTENGLTAYSSNSFLVTFPSSQVIDASAFETKVDFTVGSTLYNNSVAIGDLDCDGKVDIVAANQQGNLIAILRNISTIGAFSAGSFASKVDLSAGSRVLDVAIGDLDGDGKLDLVTTNALSNSISVFRNTSTTGEITSASFAAKVDFATGVYPYSVAIGDIDNDGSPDIVVVNSTSGTLSIFRNKSFGGLITSNSFDSKVDFATSSNPYFLALGDIDGDKKLDVVVTHSNSTVSVFRNTSSLGSISSSSLAPRVNFTTSGSPANIAIGDLDGDGKLDLVTSNHNINSVSIFRNTSTLGDISSGSFSPKVDFTTGTSPNSVTISDIDGDGKPDLAVSNGGSSSISILRNTSNSGSISPGSFAAKVDYATSADPTCIAIGDLDSDGKNDLVATNSLGAATVSVLRNTIKNSNLLAYYPFNGNANDESGYRRHGTFVNTSLTTDRFENVDYACLFQSSLNSEVQIPPINLSNSDKLTIQAWVNPTDIKTNTYCEIIRQNGSPDFLLAFQEHGTILSFGLLAGGNYGELDLTINPDDYTNSWHLITAVYDGSTKKLYKDGIEIGQTNHTGNIGFTPSSSTTIGSSTGSEFFDGKIDEVRIYNRVLSIAEIQSFFHEGGPYIGEYNSDSNTLLLMHFNESNGVIASDSSGNAHNGTATGSTIVDGRFGKARRFQGNTERVNTNFGANFGTGPFTVEFWAKLESFSQAHQNIIGNRHPQGSGTWWMGVFNNGSINFDGGSGQTISNPNDLSANKWYHLAAVRDASSNLYFYKNGVLVKKSIQSGNFTGGNDLAIGAINDGTEGTNGIIDEVRVSNIARSPQEFNLQLPPKNVSSSVDGAKVTLNWQNGGGAIELLKYRIYRGIDSINVSIIDSTIAPTYIDTSITYANVYYYRISAVDASGFESEKSSAKTAITYGLIASYPFNGNSNDESGNGYNASNNGAILTTDRFGNANKAYSFNGTSDFLDSRTLLSSVYDNFTISLWVKATLPHEIDPETNIGGDGGNGQKYVIWPTLGVVSEDGHAGMGISVGTNGVSVYEHDQDYMPAVLVYNGQLNGWSNIVVVYVNKQPQLYVNGILVRKGLTSTKIVHPSIGMGDFFPGQWGGIGGGLYGSFPGFIDDIKIYNQVLSPTEISKLYSNYNPPNIFVAEKGDGLITLKWSSEYINEIAKYRIYRDGVLIDSVIRSSSSDTVYVASGLTNYQNYQFYITSVDNFGNTSQPSKTLTESPCLIVTDYDSNTYTTIKIGGQIWMQNNLKVTHYRNGESIPEVTDNNSWAALTAGARCNHTNNPDNVSIYGRLYNFYAVTDNRNLCPTGWHAPSDDEWKTLEMHLGMSQTDAENIGLRGVDQGLQLKNTTGWYDSGNGTNTSGFSAYPGSSRYSDGLFGNIGDLGSWWTTSENSSSKAWERDLYFNSAKVNRSFSLKQYGFSVRCIKDFNSAGLVAYYPFNGNANDETGNGNNGTVNGPTLTTDRFGNQNSAYLFDGVDDNIKGLAENFPTGERTVSLWFNAINLDTYPVPFGYGGNNCGESWLMFINNPQSANAYSFQSHCNINLLKADYTTTPVNRWVNFVVSTSATGTKIFINGQELASNSNFVKNTIVTGKEFYVGACVASNGIGIESYYFKGKLDDIRIYNRELSADEIIDLYHEGGISIIGEYDPDINTVLLMHMNEISGSVVKDESNSINNGFATGTTIVDGRFGKARSFSGSDLIDIPASSSLFIGNSDFTLELWVKTNPITNSNNLLINKSSGGSFPEYKLFLWGDVAENNGRAVATLFDGTKASNTISVKKVDDNCWHHIALVRAGDNREPVKLYIDGYLDAINPSPNLLGVGNNGNLQIGNGLVSGFIDEVRLSSIIRLPEEFNLQLPPKKLTVSIDGNSVYLNWQNGGGMVSLLRYKIYRGTDSTAMVLIDSTMNTLYTDVLTNNATKYYYRVSAVDVTGFEGVKSRAVDNKLFTEINPGITSVYSGDAKWGDYNNDGFQDILIAGWNGTSYISNVYKNNGDNSFTLQTGIALPGIFNASIQWGDYNSDGYLDILLSGSSDGGIVTKIYKNNKNNNFTEQTDIILPKIEGGSVKWGDYDNDGKIDLLLTGNSISKIIRNNGNNSFEEQIIPLVGLSSSTSEWIDYDNDDDLDIIISGNNGSSYITKIYKNNSDNTFTEQTGIEISGVKNGSLDWGDYDNDGFLDFVLIGTDNNQNSISKIYHNNGAGGFADSGIDIETVGCGNVRWFDYNNDGNIDLLIAGGRNVSLFKNNGNGSFVKVHSTIEDDCVMAEISDYDIDGDLDFILTYGSTKIYSNNFTNPNTPPTAPQNLSKTINKTDATLTWDASTDNQTPSNALTYNVRVGAMPGGFDIVCPHALSNGKVTIPAMGNAQFGTSFYLKNLAPGTYYWSVQAVDNGFMGGSWAAEQSFIVESEPFTEINVGLTGVESGSVALGDYDNDGDLDILLTGYNGTTSASKVYRNDGDLIFSEQTSIVLADVHSSSAKWGDYDNDNDLDILLSGTAGAFIYRNDGNNIFTKQIELSLTGIRYCSVDWGDYDNDGNLDILITGLDGSNGISKIYRNLGNGTFAEQNNISLTGVFYSSASWGDYDNDGDLDILIAGESSPNPISKLYRNEGNNLFTQQANFIGVHKCAVAWGDYNNDGWLDIILTGNDGNSLNAKIYRNNGNNSFTEQTDISLTGVDGSSVAWGDCDNDGDLDLLITGTSSTARIAKVYRNDGNNQFNEFKGTNLTGVTNNSASSTVWGDLDNDGDLDILLIGLSDTPISKIYRNNISIPNTPPTAPENLTSSFALYDVILSWSGATDSQTTAKALSYNVRIGTTPGGHDIVSPHSLNNGLLTTPSMGNAQLRTSFYLKNLAPGTYYWSVQAVDNGYLGGAWTNEQCFIVASAISGLQSVCKEQNSTIYEVIFNSNYVYTWSVDLGTVVSGQGASKIEVNWGNTAGQGKVSLLRTIPSTGCSRVDVKSVTIANNTSPTFPVISLKRKINILVCSSKNVTYQWYRDGLAIPLATKQFYWAKDKLGSYQVEVTSSSGCKNISNSMLVSTYTGSSSLMSVYPNPTKESIVIELESADLGDGRILVYDVYGNTEKTEIISKPESLFNYIMNVDELKPGVYVVEIEVNGVRISNQKFVIL